MTADKPNLVQLFQKRCALHPERTALHYKSKGANLYFSISWAEWREKVEKTSLGLYKLGVRKGDRVAILSENRPEWAIADLAILSLGAIVVPIYPTSSPQDVSFLLQNAGVRTLFLSSLEHITRLQKEFQSTLKLDHVILFDLHHDLKNGSMSYAALLELGRVEALNNKEMYQSFVDGVSPQDLATIIYTSGTTGPPKGVMLTHGNFIANCEGAAERIKIGESDTALSFLPLSHVFERLAGYYFMIYCGASIAYAENMQTVPENMKEIRPTVCAAVPRFYEKVYARILEKVQAAPVKKKLFDWAVRTGREVRFAKRDPGLIQKLKLFAAQVLVLNKLKAGLGGRLRFFISGGAPLSKELAEFFYAAGILILEGYGLSETSPVIAVNSPEAFSFGTVGKPLVNVEVKIAEDGEILTRGPHVMQGYYQNPEATAAVLKDGWFYTGDIGTLDNRGFLKITDRKKDIIKTSGGKMISPQNIENTVLGDPLFSQIVVLGDKRNYLVALIVPNAAEVSRCAAEKGLEGKPLAELLKHPDILSMIEARFRNKTKDLASFEQVKYYALLDHELTQSAGELTPTLKVKRKVVEEKYREIIEALYQKGAVSSSGPLKVS